MQGAARAQERCDAWRRRAALLEFCPAAVDAARRLQAHGKLLRRVCGCCLHQQLLLHLRLELLLQLFLLLLLLFQLLGGGDLLLEHVRGAVAELIHAALVQPPLLGSAWPLVPQILCEELPVVHRPALAVVDS